MTTASHPAKASGEGRLEVGLAGNGTLRWAAADATRVVEEARRRDDLSPVAAAALGRCLTAAALLLRLAVTRATRLVLEVRGDGPLKSIVAEADDRGTLRGMVGDPQVDLQPTAEGKLAVGRAVGSGLLRVHRQEESGTYQSQVRLVSGEIGADIAHYLEQSEQVRSAVLLGVLARPAGVAAAGGLIVEVLPGAGEQTIARLEENLGAISGVSRLLESGGEGRLVATALAGIEREVRETRSLSYHCRCSRERLARHLAQLAPEDLEPLRLDDGTVEGVCAFCGSVYRFTADELAAVLC